MRILVTGAAGFIGSHVCRALLKRFDEVVGFDDFNDYYSPAIKRANVEELKKLGKFTEFEGDLRKTEDVEKVFGDNGFDIVCHMGARAGVRPSLENPLLYVDTNLRGTTNILEAMRKRIVPKKSNTTIKGKTRMLKSGVPNTKIVFASSSSVYGGNTWVPFSEKDPVENPWSPYAVTKRACELMLAAYHHLYAIESYALRFFTVYGPGQRPDLAIAKFVELIERGEELPFYGDGTSGRDYTYIDDIVNGVVAAIDKVKGCEIINLGGERPVTLTEMVGVIEAVLNKKAKLKKLPMQPGDVPQTYADLAKARRLLNYTPKVSFGEGVKRYVAWWREQKKA